MGRDHQGAWICDAAGDGVGLSSIMAPKLALAAIICLW